MSRDAADNNFSFTIGLVSASLVVSQTEPHQAPDPLGIYGMALVSEMPGHVAHAVERRLHELPVDQRHQSEVLGALARGPVVERGPWDRQQPTLRADGQPWAALLDHPPPHVPPQGLSFRDKKSLATASSPILA